METCLAALSRLCSLASYSWGFSWIGMFLMSGKLHFPIPGLILAGYFTGGEVSFMPFFVSRNDLLGPEVRGAASSVISGRDSLAAKRDRLKGRFLLLK